MEPLDDPVIPQKKLKKSLDPDVLADSLPNAPALPLSLPLLALPLDPVPQRECPINGGSDLDVG
ncbi:hypothetical protein AB0K68_54200 [Streptomyces sp. NPDC050698]|uniref:hypothetical protein n=1 Tax=Streptomycetaceae TaxID=2062 RepID=UPI00341EAAED